MLPQYTLTDKIITQIVKAASNTDDAAIKPEICELEDDYPVMGAYQVEAAFTLGLIAAAKMAGYSREKLEELADLATGKIR